MMNQLRTALVEQLPQTILERQSPRIESNGGDIDDDTFETDKINDDHQANIRRRAPTRHSIKSLASRKSSVKQNSTSEVSKSKQTTPLFFFIRRRIKII